MTSLQTESRSITLRLPYPISANRYWATRVVTPKGQRAMAMTYVTPEAKQYKADVLAAARAAGVIAFAGRIKLEVWLYPNQPQDHLARKRKLGATWDDGVMCMDLDNANKVLLDSLKDVAFSDDKWVRVLIAQRMEPDEHGARVVVRISPIATAAPQSTLPL
jgi:crossover junction endodeoxyribonuclease RusA